MGGGETYGPVPMWISLRESCTSIMRREDTKRHIPSHERAIQKAISVATESQQNKTLIMWTTYSIHTQTREFVRDFDCMCVGHDTHADILTYR
jgi:hypothetical protein